MLEIWSCGVKPFNVFQLNVCMYQKKVFALFKCLEIVLTKHALSKLDLNDDQTHRVSDFKVHHTSALQVEVHYTRILFT